MIPSKSQFPLSHVKVVKDERTDVEKLINPKGMPKSDPDFESEQDYLARKRVH